MTSRLRLTAMSSHREEELRAAARTIARAARTAGFDPQRRPPARVMDDDTPSDVFNQEDPLARAA
jgi:Tfp pilus assembly protein PilW